eukprot:Gb_05265 [translate_table: standard]
MVLLKKVNSNKCSPQLELKAIHLTVQFASGGRTSGRTSSAVAFCTAFPRAEFYTLLGEFIADTSCTVLNCTAAHGKQDKFQKLHLLQQNRTVSSIVPVAQNSRTVSRLFGFLDSRSYRPVEFSASDWHEKRGAGSGSTAK